MCNEMSMCKKKKRDLEDLGHTKFGKFRKGISVQFFTLHVQRNEHVQKKKRGILGTLDTLNSESSERALASSLLPSMCREMSMCNTASRCGTPSLSFGLCLVRRVVKCCQVMSVVGIVLVVLGLVGKKKFVGREVP